MLGKFRSIFSKEALEVRVEAVPEIVSELGDRGQKERVDAAKASLDAEVGKLTTMLQELSVKRTEDNYLNVLKDRFCERGLRLLAQPPAPHDTYIEAVAAAVQEISAISYKEFRHFQAMKDDMSRIASQVKLVEERLGEFRKSYHSSAEKKISDTLSLASAVREKEATFLEADTQLQQIEKAIPFIKDALESDERKLAEASGKIATLESDVRQDVAPLESERSIIKQRISTELGSVDRLLKRLQHDNPRKYATIQDYIANAGDAFIADEMLEIRTMLEDLKPLAKEEGPEKYEKVLELLRNVDFFDSLKEQHKGLTTRIMETRGAKMQELERLEREKSHLALSIEEHRAEISQLLEKRSAKAGEKERLAKELGRERAMLAERLQDLAQREVRLV